MEPAEQDQLQLPVHQPPAHCLVGLRSADSVLLPAASQVRAGPEGTKGLSCCRLNPLHDVPTCVSLLCFPILGGRVRFFHQPVPLTLERAHWWLSCKGPGFSVYETEIVRFPKTNCLSRWTKHRSRRHVVLSSHSSLGRANSLLL